MAAFADESADSHFFSYFDLFCDGDTCSAAIPGTRTIGYRDGNHLSSAGSLYIAPFLWRARFRAGGCCWLEGSDCRGAPAAPTAAGAS